MVDKAFCDLDLAISIFLFIEKYRYL